VGGHPGGKLPLDGPPLAQCAPATATEPWLQVEQDGPHVRVSADLAEVARRDGVVAFSGPITPRLEVRVVVGRSAAAVQPEVKPATVTRVRSSGSTGPGPS